MEKDQLNRLLTDKYRMFKILSLARANLDNNEIIKGLIAICGTDDKKIHCKMCRIVIKKITDYLSEENIFINWNANSPLPMMEIIKNIMHKVCYIEDYYALVFSVFEINLESGCWTDFEKGKSPIL